MAIALLSLGSNVEPEFHLRAAIAALRARFDDVVVSAVYRFPAVGYTGPAFLNAAATVRTDLTPQALNEWLHALEDAHGRDRSGPRYSDRTLDIDIVLFDDAVLDGAGHLRLPRDELRHAFVLKPAAACRSRSCGPRMRIARRCSSRWKDSTSARLPDDDGDGIASAGARGQPAVRFVASTSWRHARVTPGSRRRRDARRTGEVTAPRPVTPRPGAAPVTPTPTRGTRRPWCTPAPRRLRRLPRDRGQPRVMSRADGVSWRGLTDGSDVCHWAPRAPGDTIRIDARVQALQTERGDRSCSRRCRGAGGW